MEFFAVFSAALAAENLFFARAFDFGNMSRMNKDPKKLLMYGGLSTVILTAAGVVAYGVNRLILGTPLYNYISGLAHLLVLVLIYCGAYFLMEKYTPTLFEKLGKYLPYAAFNCATLGSLLLSAKDVELDSIAKALFYHLGAGVGFTGALLLIWSLRHRLSSCDAPKSFRGLPLQLITAGLVALALVGLTGNQLPA